MLDDAPFVFYRIVNPKNPFIAKYLQRIPAGFPSPATDYIEEDINLANYLAPNPVSIYLVRVVGDSMIDAHIPNGSLLIVDKSITPKNNQIIVASINGEFTVKRLIKNSSGIRLMPANIKYNPIPITEEMDFRVWGTVTRIIIDAKSV